MRVSGPSVFQVVGYKNTGKTTLICRLVQAFKRSGYRVGTIKHDGHDFEIDKPGTDTWKHRASGADMVAITSAFQTAMIESRPATLQELIGRMNSADIVLAEGFKAEHYPKIVLLKDREHRELLERVSFPIAAVCWYDETDAADAVAEPGKAEVPRFAIDDADGIFQLLLDHIRSNGQRGGDRG
ncbi:molybdopterin-guanine dinucleotide biosynthesis protein B [Paenibacillus contaminans]|uniref:Molybdopterin-guanine dinucleotide biosynthesis protein B n=1 Tax=Paenibacillus contaminans TaxID=450362 RepID=A0A329M251_9BACL|nr:molybdopterin-guanine dinucleotide biosynthesis protein B [Paenibacillus contaminans]